MSTSCEFPPTMKRQLNSLESYHLTYGIYNQMAIKHPTSGGQERIREAAVRLTANLSPCEKQSLLSFSTNGKDSI